MAQIEIRINGRPYPIVCNDGEEEHIGRLAQYLDRKVAELADVAGQVGDSQLLVMAGLMIADELAESRRQSEAAAGTGNGGPDEDPMADIYGEAAQRLEQVAARIEDIAARLERP